MKILLVLCWLFCSRISGQALDNLVLQETDTGFGGYYLDIDLVMKTLAVTRLQAHEIQNHLRDQLESLAQSYSRVMQEPYLKVALKNAVSAVMEKGSSPSGFRTMSFATGEFVVVLDLDETLLVQWYTHGSSYAQSTVKPQGSLAVSLRDSVAMFADRKTGNSLPEAQVRYSSHLVQLRPGIAEFCRRIKSIPGFSGFVIFTAKEDQATEDLIHYWKDMEPELFSQVLGVFTRNHLRYGGGLKSASKDLRIIDETLQHVVLIDDNDGRVMQKELNHRILKFNADGFLSANAGSALHAAHANLLDFVSLRMAVCGRNVKEVPFTQCFTKRLGGHARSDASEWQDYKKWLTSSRGVVADELSVLDHKNVFHQEWVFDIVRTAKEKFPEMKNFRLVKP